MILKCRYTVPRLLFFVCMHGGLILHLFIFYTFSSLCAQQPYGWPLHMHTASHYLLPLGCLLFYITYCLSKVASLCLEGTTVTAALITHYHFPYEVIESAVVWRQEQELWYPTEERHVNVWMLPKWNMCLIHIPLSFLGGLWDVSHEWNWFCGGRRCLKSRGHKENWGSSVFLSYISSSWCTIQVKHQSCFLKVYWW